MLSNTLISYSNRVEVIPNDKVNPCRTWVTIRKMWPTLGWPDIMCSKHPDFQSYRTSMTSKLRSTLRNTSFTPTKDQHLLLFLRAFKVKFCFSMQTSISSHFVVPYLLAFSTVLLYQLNVIHFKTTFLRYNLHSMKYAHYKCVIWWFLVNLQFDNSENHNPIWADFHHPKKFVSARFYSVLLPPSGPGTQLICSPCL